MEDKIRKIKDAFKPKVLKRRKFIPFNMMSSYDKTLAPVDSRKKGFLLADLSDIADELSAFDNQSNCSGNPTR